MITQNQPTKTGQSFGPILSRCITLGPLDKRGQLNGYSRTHPETSEEHHLRKSEKR